MENNIIALMVKLATHALVVATAAWLLVPPTEGAALGAGKEVMSTFLGASPITNCMPKPKATFLCVDRETYCTSINTSTIDHPELYCESDQKWYYDPTKACSCMVMCVDMIAQGGACKPSYSSNYPPALCDVGLSCLSVEGTQEYTCQLDPSHPCPKGVIDFQAAQQSGTKGPAMLEPLCDFEGGFAPRQCSPSSTCYCTDEDGNRLFGEDIYTNKEDMDCECARHWSKNGEIEMGLTQGLRCLPNGNIDPLQCVEGAMIAEGVRGEGFCYCYQTSPSAITDGPYAWNMLTLLSCYDPKYHSSNYTNICNQALENFNRVNPHYYDGIVIGGGRAPVCDLDGYYRPVQPTDHGTFYCSDKTGQQIEDFAFTSKEQSESKCHCATRRHLLSAADDASVVSLPVCCADGSYQGLQTRGLFAYCVDANGNQDGDAVAVTDAAALSCKKCV